MHYRCVWFLVPNEIDAPDRAFEAPGAGSQLTCCSGGQEIKGDGDECLDVLDCSHLSMEMGDRCKLAFGVLVLVLMVIL